MTWKDKLEIGLKEDAPYRKDNLPDSEVTGPEVPAGPGRSPVIAAARTQDASVATAPGKKRRVVSARAGTSKRKP